MVEATNSVAPITLYVLGIGLDPATSALVSRVLATSGDRIKVAVSLKDALTQLERAKPDVVLVDVGMEQGGGLAVLHHVHVTAPEVAVVTLARREQLELALQASGLGSSALTLLPLSGDELHTALNAVRERVHEQRSRSRRAEEAEQRTLTSALMSSPAAMEASRNRSEAAQAWLETIMQTGSVDAVVLYVPVAEGERQLVRVASVGGAPPLPTFSEQFDVENLARELGLEVLVLQFADRFEGLLLVAPREGAPGAAYFKSGDTHALAVLGAASLATLSALEQSRSAALKDPRSSAYTFAYFVDVAGREIEKATRHRRRFALVTLALEGIEAEQEVVDAVEQILAVVRDTDVVARVDEAELYLLLPETGGIGAHTCRRRVMRQLEAAGTLGPNARAALVGVASFPHDGADLSQLLRVAKHRAEASRHSSVRTLNLEGASLPMLTDLLLSAVSIGGAEAPESVSLIELPTMDAIGLAVSVVEQAARGGASRIVCGLGEGVSLGAAARATVGRDSEDIRVDAIDMKQLPGCGQLELLCLLAEHGSYTLLGKVDRGIVRAIHSADPLLVDQVVRCLHTTTGRRLFD